MTLSSSSNEALREIVAQFVDVYGTVILPAEMRELAMECYRSGLSKHVDRLIESARHG